MATAALPLHGLNCWDGRRPKPLLPEARLVDDYATSPGGSTVRFELLKARVVNVGKLTFTVDSVMVERPMAHRARFVDMHLGRDSSATLPPGEQATYYVESSTLEDGDWSREDPVTLHVRLASSQQCATGPVPLVWSMASGPPVIWLHRP